MHGPLARFAIILGLVVAVAVVAGLLVRVVAPGFDSTSEAIWWAFLRLTDPGYLGDDVGVAWASVATVVTVLGYILLRSCGARRLRVAVLAESAGADLVHELRQQRRERWSARRIILRSGSPLEIEALGRIDLAHAASVVIPAADTTASSALDADARSVKTLMMMGAALAEDPPLMVLELQDTSYAPWLRTLYPGPLEIADYDLAPGYSIFADLQKGVDQRGDIAIGLRRHQHRRDNDGGILLNPGRDEPLDLADLDDLDDLDDLVVLSRSDF